MDRHFNQAIVDKNPVVASAALAARAITGFRGVTTRELHAITVLQLFLSYSKAVLYHSRCCTSYFEQGYHFLAFTAIQFISLPASNILREEGGFDYKKAIVDSIVILIRDIPDAKESGLLHLCEFIEDCEFTYLSKQVRDRATLYLNMLGGEGAVVETEYAVNVVKDSFDSYVLFQYNLTNTIPEQLLGNVSVIVDAFEAEEFSEVSTKPLRSLPYDSPGQTFEAFEKPDGVPAVGKFSNTLKFVVKELLFLFLKTPGYYLSLLDVCVHSMVACFFRLLSGVVPPLIAMIGMEAWLQDLKVVAADDVLKVGVFNFKNASESMGPDYERVDEYGLGARESLAAVVNRSKA
ncbi:hypothetical protein RHMOL_Rhmol05G0259200 [Rhododendron molle]|uniref:Uncharacterized protein n=1 Tax=Rhododendron molle TaxID=49168 RepID=A0ACC0NTB9_RHOML|nr:hypothetical protein RHMOL_Rhmol05G0259200 [Rhododendron molle]